MESSMDRLLQEGCLHLLAVGLVELVQVQLFATIVLTLFVTLLDFRMVRLDAKQVVQRGLHLRHGCLASYGMVW